MVAIRHIPGGQLEDVSRDEALRLLRLGLVELDGPLEPETTMLAPPENAMLPPAQPRKRGRPKRARM